uniref:E3 ubiquitin-protein ligase n=1 Tax=Trichuris muris TaxID=70415 RepID=A0A5S6Q1A5_TRIMR
MEGQSELKPLIETAHDLMLHRSRFEELFKALCSYLARNVPQIYKAHDDPAKQQIPSKKIEDLLFCPIVELYCGAAKLDFNEFFARHNVPQLGASHRCNHVFANGEATYSCWDCAADPTCVLCASCFDQSGHKLHKYKITTSIGTGYCDCGDPEAWKADPFCLKHEPKNVLSSQDTLASLLPEGTELRWQMVTECLLTYIVNVLLCTSLPKKLATQQDGNSFQCVLFNDEVHSYESVIYAVMSALNCSLSIATLYVTRVDRVGRATVFCGNQASCNEIRDKVANYSAEQSVRPLVVKTIDSTFVAHQYFAQALLDWITGKLLYDCPLLLPVFCGVLMEYEGNCSRRHVKCIAARLLTADPFIWKTCRVSVQRLIMSTLLKEARSRKEFSTLFLQLYPELLDIYIIDEYSVVVCSISLSVQVFTVKSIAMNLIKTRGAFAIILKALHSRCSQYRTDDGPLTFRRETGIHPLSFISQCLKDVTYLLTNVPTADQWDDVLRVSFVRGYRALTLFLKCMQDMEKSVRFVGMHIEWEPVIETAYSIAESSTNLFQLVHEWASSDEKIASLLLKQAVCDVADYLHKQSYRSRWVDFGAQKVCCIPYDSKIDEVSFFSPLQRMLAGFYLNVPLCGSPHDAWKTHFGVEINPLELIQCALRAQVCCAETSCGMWKRNGRAAAFQEYAYRSLERRAEMYDRDVLLLQIAATLVVTERYVVQLIASFNLQNFLSHNYQESRSEEEALRILITERFLQLLIVLLGERWIIGVGTVTEQDILRRSALHVLFQGPAAFSVLEHCVSHDRSKTAQSLEKLISSIADFRPPTVSTPGYYTLKEEYLDEYNPFYWHYSKKQRAQADKFQTDLRKERPAHIKGCPPPMAPSFAPLFLPVLRIFCSESLLYMLATIFGRAAKSSRLVTETQLHRALFIVGMALNEESAQLSADSPPVEKVNFTERAAQFCKWGDLNLAQLLERIPVTKLSGMVRSLLQWTIEKLRSVERRKSASHKGEPSTDHAGSSGLELSNEDGETARKRQCRETALLKRQMAMAHIQQMQKNFQMKNKLALEETMRSLNGLSYGAETRQVKEQGFAVSLGSKQSISVPLEDASAECALCQETDTITTNGRVMVYAVLVQDSSIYRDRRKKLREEEESWNLYYSAMSFVSSVHLSTCGHTMHWDCWKAYFSGIAQQEQHQGTLWRSSITPTDPPEYLCPLCKRISNTVVPLLPGVRHLWDSSPIEEEWSYKDWKDSLAAVIDSLARWPKEMVNVRMLQIPWLRKKTFPTEDVTGRIIGAGYELERTIRLETPQVLDDSESSQTVSESDESVQLPSSVQSSSSTMPQWKPPSNYQHYYKKSIQLSNDYKTSIAAFVDSVYAFGYMRISPSSCYVLQTSYRALAYTIRCVESELELENKALFGAFSVKQRGCLTAFPRCVAYFGAAVGQHYLRFLLRQQLKPFFPLQLFEKTKEFLPGYTCAPSVLEIDLFSSYVLLTFMMTGLFSEETFEAVLPVSGPCEHHLLRLVLSALFLQIFCSSTEEDGPSLIDSTHASSADELAFQRLCTPLSTWLSLSSPLPMECVPLKHVIMREAVRKFLRMVALFQYSLTLIPPPEALKDPNIKDDFPLVCRYLGLPNTLSELVDFLDMDAMKGWCSSDRVRSLTRNRVLPRFPIVRPQRLIDLPLKYDDAIVAWSACQCPSLRTVESTSTSVCLACGRVVCTQAYCCKKSLGRRLVSNCFFHSLNCSSSIYLYLRITSCQIQVSAPGCRICLVNAPYVDAHGETDEGLTRSNPLFYNEAMYEDLQRKWMTHSIPDSGIVNFGQMAEGESASDSNRGDIMSDEDLERMLNSMQDEGNEDSVTELLKMMNENRIITREEAESIIQDQENQVVKCGLPEQVRPSDPDNKTDVDDCTSRLLANDPALVEVNLNNMKRTPVPQLQRLMYALKDNTHLKKLSLANVALNNKAVEPLLEVLECNKTLRTLNLETNFLTGDFLVRLFKAALKNQTLEEVKVVNQSATFSTEAEMDIMKAIYANMGLTKVSVDLRHPEAKGKVDRAVLRNGELKRRRRRQEASEQAAKSNG